MRDKISYANAPWIKGNPSLYQKGDITRFPDWHNLIVWDAFFNNLTSGLMVAACIIWGAGAPVFGALLPFAMTLALILLLVDLALLVLDLADSPRFIHALRVMRFTSPLSVGVWGLSSYGVFLGLAVLFTWADWAMTGSASALAFFTHILARLFTVMALIGAIVVICYKGVAFSCTSQPGIKDARWLTPFMVSDSLLMGLSAYALITLAFADINAARLLLLPFIVLLAARCITFALLWLNARKRARLVYDEQNRLVFGMVYIVGGIVAAGLLFCNIFGMTLGVCLILLCGIVERYWFVGLAGPLAEKDDNPVQQVE